MPARPNIGEHGSDGHCSGYSFFGSAIGWTYHTAPGFEPALGSTSVAVAFGSLKLVLQRVKTMTKAQPWIRCTVVNVDHSSAGGALPVADRLRLLVERVLERFPHLSCRLLLPLPSKPELLFDHKQLMVTANETVYIDNEGRSVESVRQELCSWLRTPLPPESYECFFSKSNEGKFDSQLAERVYDATTANRHTAFLDQHSLRGGDQLATVCMLGIINSRVLVPILSWPALRRLSVLTAKSAASLFFLELTLIVLLHEIYARPVFPIFVGASDLDGTADVDRDLFRSRPPCASEDGLSNALDANGKAVPDDRSVFDRMHDCTVHTVTEQVSDFFKRQGKPVPTLLDQLTVARVVQTLKDIKGAVTWQSTSAHSHGFSAQERNWGLEVGLAEEVHKVIDGAPPLAELEFAKPAYEDGVEASIKELLHSQKRMEHKLDAVHQDVKAIRALSEAHFKMLSTLLSGVDKLAPKLICFLPVGFKQKGQLKSWVSRLKKSPKDWFNQRVLVFFFDPWLRLADTNGGEGFEIAFPRAWVAKALPYIKVGLTLVKVAAVAGKLGGIPIPDVKAVVGDWVDAQLDMLSELKAEALEQMSQLTANPSLASDLLTQVDGKCSEMVSGAAEGVALVGGEPLGKTLRAPLAKSLKACHF